MILKLKNRGIRFLRDLYGNKSDNTSSIHQELQNLLTCKYREIRMNNGKLPEFREIGFRVFSQNDEDGILLYIFSLIGIKTFKCIEVCCGDGIECNTANLIVHHGWHGLLIDGKRQNIERGKEFYSKCKDTWIFPPKLIEAWVTRENINTLIESNGFSGEVDLFSLDMDGIDYWIWDALFCISPRVVVLEYHNILGPDRSVTVPYKPDFNRHDSHPDYLGASLKAFVKLGKKKGYRLIGVNKYEFNAFFMRTGIADDLFPEIDVSSCFKHPCSIDGIENGYPKIQKFEWIEV
jgi:hypothetical protein